MSVANTASCGDVPGRARRLHPVGLRHTRRGEGHRPEKLNNVFEHYSALTKWR